MTSLSADPDLVVIDDDIVGSAATWITYEKNPFDVLWERTGDFDYQGEFNKRLEESVRGQYLIKMQPATKYEVAILPEDQEPSPTDPLSPILTVHCVRKQPHAGLITDDSFGYGGTWCAATLFTKAPAHVMLAGVSRDNPYIDISGIPHPVNTDGSVRSVYADADSVRLQMDNLFPGHPYIATIVVADDDGRWDAWRRAFVALRRQFTIEFPKVHIYDDGDNIGTGEANFRFQVKTSGGTGHAIVKEFFLPTRSVDDETDFDVGFAYLSDLEVVSPERINVGVALWGVEEDGFLEGNEGAFGRAGIPFPTGSDEEVVNFQTVTVDCPAVTDGGTFHYAADVRWSVRYAK